MFFIHSFVVEEMGMWFVRTRMLDCILRHSCIMYLVLASVHGGVVT